MKLIVVDVQPEYESNTYFDIGDMLHTAVNDYDDVLFLYNGEDTLGMVSESALKDFYFEKLDYDEEAFDDLLSKSTFFDKGYGFFRDVMDSSVCFDRTSIVKIVKYMIDNDIQDIRDLEEEDVDAIGVSELLVDDLEDYGFWVPELEEVLPRWNGSDLAGGARNECMAEVEILGTAQGLSFNHIDSFIYEGENRYTEVMTESRLLREYIRGLLTEQEQERSELDKIKEVFVNGGAQAIELAGMVGLGNDPAVYEMKEVVEVVIDALDVIVGGHSPPTQDQPDMARRVWYPLVKQGLKKIYTSPSGVKGRWNESYHEIYNELSKLMKTYWGWYDAKEAASVVENLGIWAGHPVEMPK